MNVLSSNKVICRCSQDRVSVVQSFLEMDFLHLGKNCSTTPDNAILFSGWSKEPSGLNSFRPLIEAQFFSDPQGTLLLLKFCMHRSVKIGRIIFSCLLLLMQTAMLLTIPVLQAEIFIPACMFIAINLFFLFGEKITISHVQKMIFSEFREKGIVMQYLKSR